MRQKANNPVYMQLKEALMDKISTQEWKPGSRIPAERALCEQYALSRVTVRQAIGELEREGLVRRVQGKGTFVSQEKLTQPLLKLTSFSEDMWGRGLSPSAQVLALEKMPASKTVAEKLWITPGAEVIMLKRLRMANSEPMAIETAYLDDEKCGLIYDRLAQNKSMYQLMKEVLHIVPSRARQSIEIASVQGWEAKLLHMPETGMVMKIERQTFGEDLQPVEYVISKYRGDKYKLYIELEGKGNIYQRDS